MCGIIGYIGARPVAPILLDGLRRMEYRGYDSAGVALVGPEGLALRRAAGKLVNLEAAIRKEPVEGIYGLGHTRWATHGRPTEENAHPHRDCTGRIVVVHNGILENYLDLKRELESQGHTFVTETDTEIVAHLVERETRDDGLENAVRRALKQMRGMFALVLLSVDDPEKLVAARNGPPVVVGLGEDEFLVASDVTAVLAHTRDMVFLGDGEMAVITRAGVTFTDFDGTEVPAAPQRVTWDPIAAEKGGHKHFMLKEIHEQALAARETVASRVSLEQGRVFLGDLGIDDDALRAVSSVTIIACGTSWHAALVGKYMIEGFAGVPVEVDYGSEYRYRDAVVSPGELVLAITQSGETADTLAALRGVRARGAHTLAITNVVGSMVTREADGTIYTHAGPEIGVAATKTFTSQLLAVELLALYLAQVREAMSPEAIREEIGQLLKLPQLIERTLREIADPIARVAEQLASRRDFLFLGRAMNYPIALEGALKLKELSYLHAEGYPAGEMKHGPIALIDETMPVVALAPDDPVFEKMVGNVQEAKARGACVVAVVTAGDARMREVLDPRTDFVIEVPAASRLLTPVLLTLPMQLLAYDIAVRRGCDVDQPRNLAKSVTVE